MEFLVFQGVESDVALRHRILLFLAQIELFFDVLRDDHPCPGKTFAVERWVHLPANHTLLVGFQRFDVLSLEYLLSLIHI